MVSAGYNYITDLYDIYGIVQNALIRVPKDSLIASLKEYFSRDSFYHYVKDQWGFPETPDHTDLDPFAGIGNDLSTRVYIGEAFRNDVIYYPSILVRAGSYRSVPISLNRDVGVVEYDITKFIDGYGNEKNISTPSKFVMSGAWEGSLNIEIRSRGPRERDDLAEIIQMFLVDIGWNELFKMGIAVKPTGISCSAASDTEDRNDKLYMITITVEIRTEWRREIPVKNILDTISICVEMGNISKNPATIAPNIEINQKIDLLSAINSI